MKSKKLTILFSAMLLAACAGSNGKFSSSDIPRSGYLGDYSVMKPVSGDYEGEVLRWINPNLVKGKYKKVIVNPTIFYPEPKVGSQVKKENLDKISAYMTQQLKQELGKHYEITDRPGADTFELDMAITGVATTLEGLKVYEVIPVALVLAGASTALGYRDKIVTISAEWKASDSVTHEVLGKVLRQGVGENLSDDKQQLQTEQLKKLINGWAEMAGTLAAKYK